MPSFTKGGAARTPFGKNVYLRSTVGCKFESYTCAANTVPFETIDGQVTKVLQPGTIMAKITSGPDIGKIGPYQASGTAEVQTLTGTGTISGGTYTLSFNGQTTGNIAFNATAAVVQAALEALSNVGVGEIVVTGGPVNTTPLTLTFAGTLSGNQPQVTANTGSLTGTTPGITAATSTPGVAGAFDGRQTAANIVGINDTWLPWQLLEHDENVGVLYIGTAVQGWCFELDINGARIALLNATADAMRSVKGMDVTFK